MPESSVEPDVQPVTTRGIHPITRPGAWEFEGGYRRRAEQTLVVLEQKVTAWRAKVATYGTRRLIPDGEAVGNWEAADEIHALSDSVVIFAAMAVESFLNLYGVIRLGEQVYAQRYERLGPVQKLSAILATCCATQLGPQDEISAVVARLFARRNALVHPKTHEVGPDQQELLPGGTPLLPAARAAVEDMHRFHELFLTYDTDAGKWWHI
jgi:hypothetical protein